MAQNSWIGSFARWVSRWSANTAFTESGYGESILRTWEQSSQSRLKAACLPEDVITVAPDSQRTARSTQNSPSPAGASSGLLRDRCETAWLWDGSSGRWERFDWLEPT